MPRSTGRFLALCTILLACGGGSSSRGPIEYESGRRAAVTVDGLHRVKARRIKDLLREIKQLRIMCTKLKEERHNAVQELQGTKVAASRAEEKITDMRRAWRMLVKEMGTRP